MKLLDPARGVTFITEDPRDLFRPRLGVREFRRTGRRMGTRFYYCGYCQYETRHAIRRDAIGLNTALCLSCRTINEWVG